MPRYLAFLRAINVGGRVVRMDRLRREFETMSFTNVETFIASGNVAFDTRQRDIGRLEQEIERKLDAAFGFTVTTFVRTVPELAALARHPLVSGEALEDGASLFVAFMRDKPTAAATRALMALRSDVDEPHVYAHHVLWLVRGRFSGSQLSGPKLERALGMPATVRNATTVRKMVAKCRDD